MNGSRSILFLSIFFLFITGCTLAPKYKRPEPPIPDKWPEGPSYPSYMELKGPVANKLKWNEFFKEEGLKKIIDKALENNRDLRLSALNVQMARAIYGIKRAELLPGINVVGSGSKQKVPADLSPKGKETVVDQYSVNLGISSWEIDFFGRIRSLKDQALEEYLATEEARRSAQILLIYEIAYTYFNLAADKEQQRLAQSTLDTNNSIYNLIKRRYEAGLASELELKQAQTQVDTARQDVAFYSRLVAQGENALNLLAGFPIQKELLPPELSNVSPPEEISPGLSSEVLLHRPDILAAEHRLKGANAFIGAARAAFFPRISLTTAFGTASTELSGLFKSGSGTWSFVPQMVMPIFDARTWAAYDASKVEREIALTQYEKAIQTAFREVADALAFRGTVEEQLSAQKSLVEALSEAYRLAYLRYEKGIESYLTVLDAQRSLYSARKGLVTINLARISSQLKLYAVLGGGGD